MNHFHLVKMVGQLQYYLTRSLKHIEVLMIPKNKNLSRLDSFTVGSSVNKVTGKGTFMLTF